MPRLSAYIDIQQSVEVVFGILRNVARYPEYFHYVRSVSILNEEADELTAEIEEEVFGFRQRARVRFRFFPPERVIAEQLQGPLQQATAEFLLTAQDSGTRVYHTVEFEVKPSFGSGFFRRAIAETMIQARMREEMAAIKNAAEQDPND